MDGLLAVIAIGLLSALIVWLWKRLYGWFLKTASPSKVDMSKYGDCVWMDDRKAKTLYNHQYRIFGKPDAIYRNSVGEFILVEYKSRANGKIYNSDILQAKAASLSARGDTKTPFNVSMAVIITPKSFKEIPLPESNDSLYGQIYKNVDAVRNIKSGKRGSKTSHTNRCHTCGYKKHCQSSFF